MTDETDEAAFAARSGARGHVVVAAAVCTAVAFWTWIFWLLAHAMGLRF